MRMNAPIRRLSPVEFSEESGVELGTIAYHFRTLDKAGCIEVVDEERRRGAVVHFYEPVKRAMAWTREWEALGPVVRQNLAATALRGAVRADRRRHRRGDLRRPRGLAFVVGQPLG